MILADVQSVIAAQYIFLYKMKIFINEEFNKWQDGYATFRVLKQVDHMLSESQDKIIKKVYKFGSNKDDDICSKGRCCNKNSFGGTVHSGRWFYWSRVHWGVTEDWGLPNKITLQTTWRRYHLLDHESGVWLLKFLTTSDMIKQSNGNGILF